MSTPVDEHPAATNSGDNSKNVNHRTVLAPVNVITGLLPTASGPLGAGIRAAASNVRCVSLSPRDDRKASA